MDQKENFVKELQEYYGHLCVKFRDWHMRARVESGGPTELETELQLVEALIEFYQPGQDGMLIVGIGINAPSDSIRIIGNDEQMFADPIATGIAEGSPV